MTDQNVNHWNLTQEPSDMMKSNPPMPVTIAPKTSKQIEIINDDSFSYAGYQVVRGEFFAHLYEPSFTFNNYKVSVNTACIKKLPDVEYVQILVNPEQKKLAVRPCREEEKDSFRWCSTGKRRSPKQITCRIFFAKVISLMGWNPDYRYKILGKLIRSGSEILFIFDQIALFSMDNIITQPSQTTCRKEILGDEYIVPILHVLSLYFIFINVVYIIIT